jgi:hypothetical protein
VAVPADPIPSPLGASSWSGAHTRTIGSSAAEIDLRRLNKLIGRRAARPTACRAESLWNTSRKQKKFGNIVLERVKKRQLYEPFHVVSK